MSDLAPLADLLRQVRDLKRVRDARDERSLAERAFARSWGRLVAGEPPDDVALAETAGAVAAVRLAGLDADVLTAHGLAPAEAADVLREAFDDVAAPVDGALRARLRDALGPAPAPDAIPPFVDALVRQPRAGATHPGLPRLVLEPAESHADHSFAVAVFGVLLAPTFGADPTRVFLTGLSHHLFNATLPDAGFAADALIGEARLATLADAATARAVSTLPDGLRQRTRDALATTAKAHFHTPEARTFHAADVLDRVLEMAWHARSARFRLADALGRDVAAGQLDVCHEGFYQAFQQDVLQRAGVWTAHVPSGDGGPPSPLTPSPDPLA